MPTPKVTPIKPLTSWSFSRYSLYQQCPAKFKYKVLLKMEEPQNPAMARGSSIHTMAEEYTKGTLKKLPKELNLFKDDFKALKAQKVKFVEEDWAFRKDWSQTAWNDWNGCYLRVKLDAAYINVDHNALVIIDHKTGKYSENKNAEYEEQLQLYGLAGLKHNPSVDVVSPRLWYLDEGKIHPSDTDIEYFRKDEKYLEKLWAGKVKKMFADKTFKPTPNRFCQWCHYRKANGGPCEY